MGQLRFVDDDSPTRRRRGRVRRGLDTSIKAMADTGRREPIDEAFVALARTAADELDQALIDPDTSRFVRAALMGRCVAVYGALFDRGGEDDNGPSLEDLFAAADDAADL